MPPMRMKHDKDPADEVRARVGSLAGIELLFDQVLVGIYVRPDTTEKGIILADQTRQEDVYQGKVGLVLMKGPRAFKDEGDVQFHGQNVEVGEWVFYRPSDGWPLTINKTECRILRDVQIKARVSEPDSVW